MQQPSTPKTRRKYDADFKNEVVKMLANGQTATYVSKALGVSENLIYRWKNQNQGIKKVSSKQSELALENLQLKDRVRQLETEREIFIVYPIVCTTVRPNEMVSLKPTHFLDHSEIEDRTFICFFLPFCSHLIWR